LNLKQINLKFLPILFVALHFHQFFIYLFCFTFKLVECNYLSLEGHSKCQEGRKPYLTASKTQTLESKMLLHMAIKFSDESFLSRHLKFFGAY